MSTPERIHFSCPHCGSKLRAPLDRAGLRAKCKGCGNKVEVPAAALPTPEPPTPRAVEVAAPIPAAPVPAVPSDPAGRSAPRRPLERVMLRVERMNLAEQFLAGAALVGFVVGIVQLNNPAGSERLTVDQAVTFGWCALGLAVASLAVLVYMFVAVAREPAGAPSSTGGGKRVRGRLWQYDSDSDLFECRGCKAAPPGRLLDGKDVAACPFCGTTSDEAEADAARAVEYARLFDDWQAKPPEEQRVVLWCRACAGKLAVDTTRRGDALPCPRCQKVHRVADSFSFQADGRKAYESFSDTSGSRWEMLYADLGVGYEYCG